MQTLGKVGKARWDPPQNCLPSLKSEACIPMQTGYEKERLWSSIVKGGSKPVKSSEQSLERHKKCHVTSERSIQSKSKQTGHNEDSVTIYKRKTTKGDHSDILQTGSYLSGGPPARSKELDKNSACTPETAFQENNAYKHGSKSIIIEEDQKEKKPVLEFSLRPQSKFMTVSRAENSSINDPRQAAGLGSDEDITLFCIPCNRDGAGEAAFGYCENCSEFLCKSCLKHHKKATPSRHHTLLDKDEMPVSQQPQLQSTVLAKPQLPSNLVTQPQLPPNPLAQPQLPSNLLAQPSLPSTLLTKTHKVRGYCSRHQKESLKYMCTEHRQIACSVCVMLEHRNCNIEYIPEVSKYIVNSKHYFDTSERMETFVRLCKDIKDEMKQMVEKSNESLKSVLPLVKHFRQTVNERFNELENDMENISESLCKENNKKLKGTEVKLDYMERSVRGESNEIKHLNATGQTDALFMELIESENMLAEHEENVSNLKSNLNICEYELIRNPSLSCLFENEMPLGTIQQKVEDPASRNEQPEMADDP
ncbi:uncharacterized protein LOC123538892 isoform X2 [Mercenaria mercenaria]|uniref:uncharacterized protein LOC123538892 isoform X2 n=1 Tax=Mercenaria mercenaria TaxID=6596 RepID=UPI00234F0337|nr:uncharacterized protein LOC123538892 isoform X2 [Mercenaria mercenaria]